MKLPEIVLSRWDDDRTTDLEPALEPRQPNKTALPNKTAVEHTVQIQEPAADQLLRGRYLLVRPIGTGGTSIVYCARDMRRDEAGLESSYVALKMLQPEISKDPRAVARLEREFACAQALSHPNIVRVFDLDCHTDDNGEQRWFLTMELLEGELLDAVLKRATPNPLSTSQTYDVLKTCGNALAYAHERGVVHGDFKPGNIFITRQGRICLLDFGAAAGEIAEGTRPVARSATPAYASPEILAGHKPERRDDVFAFACVAYRMLTGSHPFKDGYADGKQEPLRSWDLTDRQWFALDSALGPRERRPSDVRRLLADLTPPPPITAIPRPVEATPPSSFGSVLKPIAAFALIAAVGAGLFLASPQPAGQSFQDRVAALLSGNKTVAPETKQGSESDLAAPIAAIETAAIGSDSTGAPPIEADTSVPPEPQIQTQTEYAPSLPAAPVPPPAAIEQTPPVLTPSVTPTTASKSASSTAPQRRQRLAQQPVEPVPVEDSWISFDTPSITVSEGAPAVVLTLTRSHNSVGRALVNWRILPESSTAAGVDFDASALFGTTEFADGQTKRAIFISLYNDAVVEPKKIFYVDLYHPSNERVRLGPETRVTVTILDDDR